MVVIPDRAKQPGLDHPSQPVPTLQPIPFSEALARRWPTDAHVLLYSFADEAEWPRVNKTSLAALLAAGARVSVSITALDWDMPGHGDLTPEAYETFQSDLAASNLPVPTYMYPTTHGARIFYVHQPLDPLDAEAVHRGLVSRFLAQGIILDHKVWEWNRPHRLPFVQRDGIPTPDVEVIEGLALDASVVVRVAPKNHVAIDAAHLAIPMPGRIDAEGLIWNGEQPTAWTKDAKKRARGRMDGAIEAMLQRLPPAVPKGERNSTFMKWIGSATAVFENMDVFTPAHMLGLFYPTVEANQVPGESRNLLAETWKMILYCFARSKAVAKANAVESANFSDSLVQTIRQWPSAPPADPDWVKERLVLSHDGTYYVLEAPGYYSSIPVKPSRLPGVLRTSGLVGPDRLLPSILGLDPQTINDRFTRDIREVVMQAGVAGSYLDDDARRLYLRTFARRSDLQPEHHAGVDGWLRAWFGDHYDRIEPWLANALAFEEGPICALSIDAPPGSGKNLLVQGLADTIDTGEKAGKEVFGNWQYDMLRTPWIHVDESPPDVRNFDSKFREMVTGGSHNVNRKNLAPVRVVYMPRLILTANGGVMMDALFKRKGMTPDERRAIQTRVLHVNLSGRTAGADFIRKNGGRPWVRDWVKSAYTKTPNFALAKHLLWLYQSYLDSGRIDQSEDRLLVSGSTAFDVSAHLNDHSILIGQTLVALLTRGRLTRKGEHFYVKASDIMDQLELSPSSAARDMNLKTVGMALNSFCDPRKTVSDGAFKARRLRLGRLKAFCDSVDLEFPALEPESNATQHQPDQQVSGMS